MSYPKYPEYKDSGVSWLGSIPSTWNITSIKYGYEVVLGKMLQPNKSVDSDQLMHYLRASNIKWEGVDLSDVKSMWFSPKEVASLDLRAGDLLVSEGGDVGRSCLWKGELQSCGFQNAINRLRSLGRNSTEYLYFWISFLKTSGYIDIICNKATIAHLTAEKLSALPLVLPDYSEQLAVAKFLKRETAKIQGLILEQEQLVIALKEKRQALIAQTVTQGLAPSVLMKESEIPWLGPIPAHWGVARLKDVVDKICPGGTPESGNKDFWDFENSESSIPWVAIGDMSTKSFVIETEKRLTPAGLASKRLTVLEPGTILYSIYASIGKVSVLDIYATTNQAVLGITPNKTMVNAGFLGNWLIGLEEHLGIFVSSNTQDNLNANKVRNLPVYLPPLLEQKAITEFIGCEVGKINNLIRQQQLLMASMQARRTALISAAVTGQIDVRQLSTITKDENTNG